MKKTILLATLIAPLAINAQTYSQYISEVDEYVPAPGQFINTLPAYEEGDDAASMAKKCTERIAGDTKSLVSLGGYGGYITFHFDHSIANVEGSKDFAVYGNAFKGSSEPGVVMVSRDDNKNGLPDDQWYELRGSVDEDSIGKVVYNYEITYKYDAMKDIPWTDNQGSTGYVYRNNYHKQEYYPLWLTGSDLTFKGTLLPKNGVDTSGKGTYWVLSAFAWGYVDNQPNTDVDGCGFDISWAVDEDRNSVTLDRIDFVRVYNGMNQTCGWLGETSTEVIGAEDLHLEASISLGITPISKGSATEVSRYTIDGRRLQSPTKGLNIIKMSDGSIIKEVKK